MVLLRVPGVVASGSGSRVENLTDPKPIGFCNKVPLKGTIVGFCNKAPLKGYYSRVL